MPWLKWNASTSSKTTKFPGQTGYTAEHAQQILEGFPKPPPAAPKPPTATTEMLVDTEVIEEFPEEQQPKGLEKLLKVSALWIL